MVFKTRGTCASQISFDLIDGKIYNVTFTGGCNGNLKGIAALVEGQDACVLPRAVPVVEAMAAMTILDYLLLANSSK